MTGIPAYKGIREIDPKPPITGNFLMGWPQQPEEEDELTQRIRAYRGGPVTPGLPEPETVRRPAPEAGIGTEEWYFQQQQEKDVALDRQRMQEREFREHPLRTMFSPYYSTEPGLERTPEQEATDIGIGFTPGLEMLQGVRDVGRMIRDPEYAQRLGRGGRLLTWLGATPLVASGLKKVGQVAPQIKRIARSDLPRRIADWRPQELTAWGQRHGVRRALGAQSPNIAVTTVRGRPVNIPGGTEGKWSYIDLLRLKAQGIDPNELPSGVHRAMQRKLLRSMAPDKLTDEDVFRGFLFGMTSPGNPLISNEFAVARMMPQNMGDIRRLASMRGKTSQEIAEAYGLQKNLPGQPGLGARGKVRYDFIAELAHHFVNDPKWWRKRGNEPWDNYIERISTQQSGIAQKTGSFSGVWQDLPGANISAIDVHMGRRLYDELPPARQRLIQRKARDTWNQASSQSSQTPEYVKRKADRDLLPEEIEMERIRDVPSGMLTPEQAALLAARRRGRQATSFNDLLSLPGGRSHFEAVLESEVAAQKTGKFRLKSGEINPALPKHLRNEKWLVEPENVSMLGPLYREALDVNARYADDLGMSVFGAQWYLWDKVRKRFEPHEVMYPELWKLPRQTLDELTTSLDFQKGLGYWSPGAVESTGNPMKMAYWGVGGLAAGGTARAAARRKAEREKNQGG